MAERAQAVEIKAAARAKSVVEELLHEYRPRNFAVEFWDGSRRDPDPGQFCRFTWHIHHPSVLRALLRSDRQVALGEAFIHGDFDVSGDLLAIFPVAEYLEQKHFGPGRKLRLGSLLLGLPSQRREEEDVRVELRGRAHSKARDRQAVSFHYDVSNAFYQLWLDPAMIYSCAYFKSPDDSLPTAQAQKLDHICRKLRLRPGERLLDLGCGWGGLIMHAARYYGVQAVGITLSEQQLCLRSSESGTLYSHPAVRFDYLIIARPANLVSSTNLPASAWSNMWERARCQNIFVALSRRSSQAGLFSITELAAREIDPNLRSALSPTSTSFPMVN